MNKAIPSFFLIDKPPDFTAHEKKLFLKPFVFLLSVHLQMSPTALLS